MLPRIEPDLAAVEVAHRILRTPLSIEQMMASRPLSLILQNVARRHMQRRQAHDAKRLQANDYEKQPMTSPTLLPGDRVRFTDPYEGIVAGRVIEILPPSPRLRDCIVQPDYALPGTVWRLPMAALERESVLA